MTQKIKGHRYISVGIDNFNNFGWAVPFKNKSGRIIKKLKFFNFDFLIKKTKFNFKKDDWNELINKISNNSLEKIKTKRYDPCSSKGAVSVEKLKVTSRVVGEKPVFCKSTANWIE